METPYRIDDPKRISAGAAAIFQHSLHETGLNPYPLDMIYEAFDPIAYTIALQKYPNHHNLYVYDDIPTLADRAIRPRNPEATYLRNGKPSIVQIYNDSAMVDSRIPNNGISETIFYFNASQDNKILRVQGSPLLVVPPKGIRNINAAHDLYLDSDFVGTVVLPYDYAQKKGYLEEDPPAFVDHESYAGLAVELSTHQFDTLM